MTKMPIRYVLLAWLFCGATRVLLGSGTFPVAYFFFGLFWLMSAALVAIALLLLVKAEKAEERIEAVSLCALVFALFAAGLFAAGRVAILVFLAAAVTLAYVFLRRLRRDSQRGVGTGTPPDPPARSDQEIG